MLFWYCLFRSLCNISIWALIAFLSKYTLITTVGGGVAFSVFLDHDTDGTGQEQTVIFNKVSPPPFCNKTPIVDGRFGNQE